METTTTHSPEQVAYAVKMAHEMTAKKEGSSFEFWYPMALRLAETAIVDVYEKPESVGRNYKCVNCKTVDERAVSIDYETKNKQGNFYGQWVCDDCGEDWYMWVKIGKKD